MVMKKNGKKSCAGFLPPVMHKDKDKDEGEDAPCAVRHDAGASSSAVFGRGRVICSTSCFTLSMERCISAFSSKNVVTAICCSSMAV
jgi:hypothetical protein